MLPFQLTNDMGIYVCGWVEISQLDPERRAEEHAWRAVINVETLIDDCDEISELLFGFSKRALTGGLLPCVPVAAKRGIPPNPSQVVQRDLQDIQAHEQKSGPEMLGHTYLDATEIDSLDWSSYGISDLESSNWWLIFKMIRLLRSDDRFKYVGIRIVCWVSW